MNYLFYLPEELIIIISNYVKSNSFMGFCKLFSIDMNKKILLNLSYNIFKDVKFYNKFTKLHNNLNNHEGLFYKVLEILKYSFKKLPVFKNNKYYDSMQDGIMLITRNYFKSEFIFKIILRSYYPEMYKKINLIIHIFGNNPRYILLDQIYEFMELYELMKMKKDFSLPVEILDYINTGKLPTKKFILYKEYPILISFLLYFEKIINLGSDDDNITNIIVNKFHRKLGIYLRINDKRFIKNMLKNPRDYRLLLSKI